MWSPGLSESEITRLVHAAIDLGVTSLDTAPLYDFGRSEEIVGRALSGRRSRVQILTKAGLRWDDAHGRVLFEFTDRGGVRRAVRKDSRPKSLKAEVESSLRRLRADQIDLLQIHHPDIDTPIAESLGELARLRDAGLIRAIGVSNYSAPQLQLAVDALGPDGLDALQCEYNLLQRWPEQELLPLCRAHTVGVLAYSPLAKGLLAGFGRKHDRRLPVASRGGSHGRFLSSLAVRAAVKLVSEPIARRHGASPDQVALAWLLAQPGLTSAVAGGSTLEQVRANAAAASLSLTPTEISGLSSAFGGLRIPLHLLGR